MRIAKPKFFLTLLIILMIFFSLNKLGIQKLRNKIFLISSPLQEALWQGGEKISTTFQAVFEANNLKKEIQELKESNLKLQYQVISLKELARENKTLREALNLELEKEFNLNLAKVISQKTQGDFLLINQGEKAGISEDKPVISSEKVLLGKIGQVFDDFSTVRLISSKDFTFDIEVLTESGKVLGVAEGKGNLKVQFQFIPKDSQIREGDKVITSRLAGNFPQGLLVGEIKTIKRSDVEPFLTGEITPYFPKLELETIFVIKEFR